MNKGKIIKLTIRLSNTEVFINSKMIGHFYRVEEEKNIKGLLEKRSYTKVGHLTHNNGGFEVLETPEQIIQLLTNKNKQK